MVNVFAAIRFLVLALAVALTTAAFGAPASAQQARWHGDYFPNIALTDHTGRQVRFYDDLIKDKVVLINFVYTECADVCPLDTAALRRVQALLGDRVGRDIFMYSISINPQRDTPATLRNYMQMYEVGPGWTFLTGDLDDIRGLERSLGISIGEEDELRQHDTSLIVGNETTGQWIKRSPFDNPQVIATLLGETLHNYAAGSRGAPRQSYAVAGELAPRSRGEQLYRTRCASCHALGTGDGLGPDLLGVATSRPRPWLARWLREPDRMIAERDPTAVALMRRFRNLPMPNLSLNEVDVDALIAFMVEQDMAAAPHGQHSHAH